MPSNGTTVVRLGTRGSLLARTQSQIVANAVEKAHPGVHVELVTIRTSGDRITDRPLHDVGGKGLFTKEIEQALLSGEVDFAVHSFKDVPVTMPLVDTSGLVIAAVPGREDPRDVLAAEGAPTLDALPQGARVGTGSLRRRCQLLERRPDLRLEPLRGNIDTRLRKQRDEGMDAVVVALAALERLELTEHVAEVLEPGVMLPQVAQGALAIECRADDDATRARVGAIEDAVVRRAVDAERAYLRTLGGGCDLPVGALAAVDGPEIVLDALLASADGHTVVRTRVSGTDPDDVGETAAQFLMEKSA